jgi:hypothetical protein
MASVGESETKKEEKQKLEIRNVEYVNKKNSEKFSLILAAAQIPKNGEMFPPLKRVVTAILTESLEFCGLNQSWVTDTIRNSRYIFYMYAKKIEGGKQVVNKCIGVCAISHKPDPSYISEISGSSDLCQGMGSRDCAEISTLCVDKNFPGSGTILLNYVKDMMSAMNYKVLTLHSLPKAKKFYENNGFKTIKIYEDEYSLDLGYGSGDEVYYDDTTLKFFILDKRNENDKKYNQDGKLQDYAEQLEKEDSEAYAEMLEKAEKANEQTAGKQSNKKKRTRSNKKNNRAKNKHNTKNNKKYKKKLLKSRRR